MFYHLNTLSLTYQLYSFSVGKTCGSVSGFPVRLGDRLACLSTFLICSASPLPVSSSPLLGARKGFIT
jgi:hypothetical protein